MALDLGFFAQSLHLSYSYLSTLFKSELGMTFKEYLNLVRIQNACELLKKRNCSVSETAELVGYSNPYYFSKVFKKIQDIVRRNIAKDLIWHKPWYISYESFCILDRFVAFRTLKENLGICCRHKILFKHLRLIKSNSGKIRILYHAKSEWVNATSYIWKNLL